MATMTTGQPPRSAREVVRGLRAAERTRQGTFSPAQVRALPEPARRWLTHAIAPGAPLADRATLTTHGEIRLGRRWHRFTAKQLLVPDAGFVWTARTALAGLPLSGIDAYADGVGAMRWRLLGAPIVRRSGEGVTRSALDRLVAESVLLPTSLLDADWSQLCGPDSAAYTRAVQGRYARSPVTVEVGPDGRLQGLHMQRWGNPAGGAYDLQPFAVRFDDEYRAGPLLVPDGIHASWPESGGEFFRATLDSVDVA